MMVEAYSMTIWWS